MKKLGFGFKRLPLKNQNDLKDIDFKQLNHMVDVYIEGGFNFFDTAYNYHNGQSEEAIRKAVIERYPRESIVLSDKLPTIILDNVYDLEKIFNKQLERCGVSYFDYYCIDVDPFSEKKLLKDETYDFIEEKKNNDQIKNIGLCFNGKPQLLNDILAGHPGLDIVQLPLNYLDWSYEGISSKSLYEVARKYKKDIIVKDPYKGRYLIDLPVTVSRMYNEYNNRLSNASWAIRFLNSLDGVKLVISNMSKIEHVNDNITFMDNFKPLNETESKLIDKTRNIIIKRMEIPCISCDACLDACPMDILIPRYIDLYSTYRMSSGLRNYSQKKYYKSYSLNVKYRGALDCIGCEMCLNVCPKNIDIPEVLSKVALAFDDFSAY